MKNKTGNRRYIVVSIPYEEDDLEPLCFVESDIFYKTAEEALKYCKERAQDSVDDYNKENEPCKFDELWIKVDNKARGKNRDLGYDPDQLLEGYCRMRYRVVMTNMPEEP